MWTAVCWGREALREYHVWYVEGFGEERMRLEQISCEPKVQDPGGDLMHTEGFEPTTMCL